MPYPVSVTVQPVLANRNRLTTAFRLILAIPHLILVGGVGIGFASGTSSGGSSSTVTLGGEGGVLGAVALVLAIVSWFTILFSGSHIAGIRQFTAFYLRWHARAAAYIMLLEDAYPPFGDAPYPVSMEIVDPAGPRNGLSVAFRIFYALPHYILLGFVIVGWSVTTILAWFIILFTKRYPQGLYEFGVGTLRWVLRVQAYTLLMVDEYPPFSFS
jgi:hypothetical protein